MIHNPILAAALLIAAGILSAFMIWFANKITQPLIVHTNGGANPHILDELAKGQYSSLITVLQHDVSMIRDQLSEWKRAVAECELSKVQMQEQIAELRAQVAECQTRITQLMKPGRA